MSSSEEEFELIYATLFVGKGEGVLATDLGGELELRDDDLLEFQDNFEGLPTGEHWLELAYDTGDIS